ncbi:hypothetical protein RAS12_30760 (plasmid) [Achromobacter seleniivolatilans]|uniref:Uncharacterized protein n=1 Tax=Achromobacter seleniivolatilans TaxID=3047478 RepID=A0ABY9MAG2_9BURK|nr:hypothetical protein [Achromobacter sp. R39]WMD24016.1 hypothetical protein RAS12_30760 [Achromobacter sp. R39]
MKEQLWTIVRFPDGSWSYGGKPNDPAYEFCEKWQIPAVEAKQAVKLAQARRRRTLPKRLQTIYETLCPDDRLDAADPRRPTIVEEMRQVVEATSDADAVSAISWWNIWPNPQHLNAQDFVRAARELFRRVDSPSAHTAPKEAQAL